MSRLCVFALLCNISFSCSLMVHQAELLEALKDVPTLTILLSSNEEAENEFVRFFLNQAESSVVICTFPDKAEAELDVDALFLTDTAHLNDTMSSYAMIQRVFFIIITDEKLDKAWVVQVLYDLWIRKSIFKVHILSDCGIFVFDQFYYPYGSNKSGELVPITEKDDFASLKDMNGFPMRVLIFNAFLSEVSYDEQTGRVVLRKTPNANMAQILEKQLNFKMNLLKPDGYQYGHKLPNGSFNGALGYITRSEVDIVLTGFFVKDYSTKDIEFSVAVDSDKLCCYVQKAQRIPESILPILAVRHFIWVAFFCVVTMSGMVWIALRSANHWTLHIPWLSPQSDLIRIVIDTWVVSVRADMLHMPSFNSERIFWLSLSAVSIIFGAFFESCLSTAYIKPFYYKDLTTLKELNESGIVIYYRYDDFKNDILSYSSLRNEFEYFNDSAIAETTRVSSHSEYGGLVRRQLVMQYVVQALYQRKIHVIKECLHNYRIAYLLKKRSPYQVATNRVLLMALEAGLVGHWYREIHYKNRLAIFKQPKVDDYAYTNLKLHNLQLCFYILIIGCVLSFVMFAVELYV